ncbi:MAG: alpha/beta hydrolase [Flavobacteriaceae bacterium]|jgi:pimeloyl-ACP methyl ester carboxylesterase|nr:alpha/beta hydrolase [Flavobacteriaceae bacterium]
MNKIPIYFIPGMCSNSAIFERVHLNPDLFDCYYLEWLPTNPSESLNNYVDRMAKEIRHENPVLIGVSFGGIIAQELSKKIIVRQTIIISSARSNKEYPPLYKFAKYTGAYKLLPTGNITKLIKQFVRITTNSSKQDRMELYDRYITIRDKEYIDWCIREIVNWTPSADFTNTIQIQGTKDELFPFKYVKNAIPIPKGTHTMIFLKYKWFNENLEKLILK